MGALAEQVERVLKGKMSIGVVFTVEDSTLPSPSLVHRRLIRALEAAWHVDDDHPTGFNAVSVVTAMS
jgi:hypothetical protein